MPANNRLLLSLTLGTALMSLIWGASPATAAVELYPEASIRPGLIAQVRTVLQGSEPETIDLEILGRLEAGIGPGIDMILGRLLGEKGQFVGVAAGMSGSPVTIDGKLVGSLSYSIGGFNKEPLLGITPIRAMLQLQEFPGGVLPWNAQAAPAGCATLPLTLVAPGLSPAAVEQMDGLWQQLGVGRPVTGGSAAGPVPMPARLAPGDPVAALLIWGDMQIGAIGTVTWRDGDQLLAFGHPFLSQGRSALPLAPAEIVYTVASLSYSFKLGRMGEPVGTMLQDRLTAIGGKIGPVPAGLPVTLSMARPGRPVVRRQFQLARDPFYTPILASMAFQAAVVEGIGAERDEALKVQGTVRLANGRTLPFQAVSNSAQFSTAERQIGQALSNQIQALVQPPFPLPAIEAIDLTIHTVEPETNWVLERVQPERLALAPGETLPVRVEMKASRGQRRQERLRFELPADLRPGRYLLLVGSAQAVARELGESPEPRRVTAKTAEDYLAAFDQESTEDRLEMVLARPTPGVVADGHSYPALPESVGTLLRARAGANGLVRAPAWAVLHTGLDLEQALLGLAKITIDIIPAESNR